MKIHQTLRLSFTGQAVILFAFLIFWEHFVLNILSELLGGAHILYICRCIYNIRIYFATFCKKVTYPENEKLAEEIGKSFFFMCNSRTNDHHHFVST